MVKFLDGVAEASDAAAKKLTDNKLFIIVANEVLQVYMAEMNEDMRNLYLSAYSMPKTSEAVLMRSANILYEQFSDILPGFAKKISMSLKLQLWVSCEAICQCPAICISLLRLRLKS